MSFAVKIMYVIKGDKTLWGYAISHKWSKIGKSFSVIERLIRQYLMIMSCVVRKPDFCIWKKKGADQVRGKPAAFQCL